MTVRRAIPTSCAGEPNGWLLPIWNEREDDWRPKQVYLTVVAPGAQKGPHLHMKRCGRFICIKGDVMVVQRPRKSYLRTLTGDNCGYELVEVAAGVPAAIYNVHANISAYVLNLGSSPWTADDPDEWPVEGWDFSHALLDMESDDK